MQYDDLQNAISAALDNADKESADELVKEIMNSLDSLENDLVSQQFAVNLGGNLIDLGGLLNDEKVIRRGIELITIALNSYDGLRNDPAVHYNIANGYSSCWRLERLAKKKWIFNEFRFFPGKK